jgi:hypothetical protein
MLLLANFSSESSKEVLKMEKIFTEAAERLNGRLAMLGFVAAVGAYFTTGQVIPGIW